MKRTLPLFALLIACAACDRSDPPVNQVGIDLDSLTDENEAAEPEADAAVENLADADANAADPVAATVAGALPAAYQGVFDQTAAACGSRSSIYRLTVSGKELEFHESLAEIKSVTPAGDGAVRIAANYSGEGMTWSNTQKVALSDGGKKLTITGDGEPVVRVRCP